MKELPKKYDHKEAEKRWQATWDTSGVYHWEEDQPRENTYVIDTPPPTVSGVLHMGHIFSYTQADFIARFQRMAGKTVFYPMGYDDNGLPTERLVEKTKKVRATDMSREAFIALCEEVSAEARAEFRKLFVSTALSVDWRQEYHTISEESRKISQLSFLDLYRKEHVYRKLQPMLWDPVDQTAIAQAEIEDKELPSHFSDIRFMIAEDEELRSGDRASPEPRPIGAPVLHERSAEAGASGKGAHGAQLNEIIIATTRPELIPACVAIFYHPDDERYRHLKGKHAITPLFGVKVPIMEDDTVEPEKGTGIMMCCTFGDEADIEKWRKHDLPTRVVLNKYGKMDFSAFSEGTEGGQQADPALSPAHCAAQEARAGAIEKLQNKKVSNKDPKHPGARETILQMLEDSGDLIESKPITHAVKCAERSGAPLEILPTHQWFVNVLEHRDALKDKAAACTWYPQWMKLRMDQWIDGLNWDWCISRQRYYGVPFPVWYSKREGEEGKILVASPDQLPVNPMVDLPEGYSREEVEAELDVMDTWATSSVSPQLSSKGICHSGQAQREPESSTNKELDSRFRGNDNFVLDAQRHAKLYPADLRPQAHEIIRTWAFYTVVKSYLHADSIPWHNLMISGWCLASDKTKMSKSKGNVVTPVELIEEKGTDAVRYWASTSKLGTDTAFSEDLLKIGKKLVTKLFNASKFASLQLGEMNGTPSTAKSDVENGIITEALDQWILTRLHRAIEKSTNAFQAYEYSDARSATEDFFWNDFCDNYLELVKARAYGNDTPESQQSALYTLHHCLNGILKLFAPIVPHITEELFSYIFDTEFEQCGSIHARGMWPNAGNYPCMEEAEQTGIATVAVLGAIRGAKSDKGVSIKYPITRAELQGDMTLLSPALSDLKSAGNVVEIVQGNNGETEVKTEDDRFTLSLTFAEAADVA